MFLMPGLRKYSVTYYFLCKNTFVVFWEEEEGASLQNKSGNLTTVDMYVVTCQATIGQELLHRALIS